MRYKPLYMISLPILLSGLLFGCDIQSEEEALDKATNSAEEIFSKQEDIKANEKTAEFDFYLPEDLEIKEKTKSNLILSDGNEHYIVFYNKLEPPESKLTYESAKDSKSLVYESFENDDQFGYLQITKGTEENYQIQVGIGGVKITTYSTKKDLEETSGELMKIASSITQDEVKS